MICTICGAENGADAKFCTACGLPLPAAAAAAGGGEAAPAAEPAANAAGPAADQPAKPKKKPAKAKKPAEKESLAAEAADAAKAEAPETAAAPVEAQDEPASTLPETADPMPSAADEPAAQPQPAPEADAALDEFLKKRPATSDEEREAAWKSAEAGAMAGGLDGYKSYTSGARAEAYRTAAAERRPAGDSSMEWAAWVGCISGGLAVLSGFFSLPGLLFGVCGIVFGILGLKSPRRSAAIVGIVLAAMGLSLSLIMLAVWRAILRELFSFLMRQGGSGYYWGW